MSEQTNSDIFIQLMNEYTQYFFKKEQTMDIATIKMLSERN